MIKISKRLQKIATLIEDNSSIIDVGCDHGLLSIYLYLNKNNINIIASDINKNALSNAILNIKKYGLEDNIKTIISNGLENIDIKGVDTIVISGMGTNTIIDILSTDISKLNNINNIIISSNNKQELLRRSITSLGYYIDNELLIEDRGKIYHIIKFTKGTLKYSKKEYKYGPILLKNKDEIFIKNINNLINKNKEILQSIPWYRVILKIKKYIKIISLKKIIKS